MVGYKDIHGLVTLPSNKVRHDAQYHVHFFILFCFFEFCCKEIENFYVNAFSHTGKGNNNPKGWKYIFLPNEET